MSTILSLAKLTGFALELTPLAKHPYQHMFFKFKEPLKSSIHDIHCNFIDSIVECYSINSLEDKLKVDRYYLLYTLKKEDLSPEVRFIEFSELDSLTEHKKRLDVASLKEINILTLPGSCTICQKVYISTTCNSLFDAIPFKVTLI